MKSSHALMPRRQTMRSWSSRWGACSEWRSSTLAGSSVWLGSVSMRVRHDDARELHRRAQRAVRRRRSLGSLFLLSPSALIHALVGRWFADGCREVYGLRRLRELRHVRSRLPRGQHRAAGRPAGRCGSITASSASRALTSAPKARSSCRWQNAEPSPVPSSEDRPNDSAEQREAGD